MTDYQNTTSHKVTEAIQARLDSKTKGYDELAKLARDALDSMYGPGDERATSEMVELAAFLMVHTDEIPELACYPTPPPEDVTVDEKGFVRFKSVVLGIADKQPDGWWARILGGYNAGPFGTQDEAILNLCKVNEVPA